MPKHCGSIIDNPVLMAALKRKESSKSWNNRNDTSQTHPWTKKRKGKYWSKDEENYLCDGFDRFVAKAAREHGRTENAILCRIYQCYDWSDCA